MDTSEDVYWDYNKIDYFKFNDVGINLGIGLDIHPDKDAFFIRLSYDHEIYNPDIEVKTEKRTYYVDSDDIYGDTDFHNRAFTIAIGWQFRRKNIVKNDTQVPENKPQEELQEISFNYVDIPTMEDHYLFND